MLKLVPSTRQETNNKEVKLATPPVKTTLKLSTTGTPNGLVTQTNASSGFNNRFESKAPPATTLKLPTGPVKLLLAGPSALVEHKTPPGMVKLTLNPTIDQGPRASDYEKMKHEEQIYQIPDTYLGSDTKMDREVPLLDLEKRTIYRAIINLPMAIERIFVEPESNANDNVNRSRRAGVDPGRIEVTMNKTTISIRNYGLPIPVEINDKHNVYAPELIFGNLLTSSNYNKLERQEAGRNGYGAKLSNIFSTEFIVVVYDDIRHLQYRQVWRNNMKIKDEPIITPYSGPSMVEVTYTLDFARFGYDPVVGYPPEFFALVARHCADASFTCKIPVVFNGQEMDYSDVKDYARLFFGEAIDNNCIVYYEWPENTAINTAKNGRQTAVDPSVMPIIEMCVVDTPDAGYSVAFTNSIINVDGGVHLDAALKSVSSLAISTVNNYSSRGKTAKTGGKGKGKGTKGKKLASRVKTKATQVESKGAVKKVSLDVRAVRPHISIILNCRLINPKFRDQSKTYLTTPSPKLKIDEEDLEPMLKWQLVGRLLSELEARQFKKIKDLTDGRKADFVNLEKGNDAKMAGKEPHRCTLYAVEGRSAMSYVTNFISISEGKRIYNGAIPLQGKPLNVMNAPPLQIANNKVYQLLKKALGLSDGVDYTLDENFNRLRYHYFVILTDADDDGRHIAGLVINYFYCKHPSLLARGFVMYMRTPYRRVWLNKGPRLCFYSVQEYRNWEKKTPNAADYESKYYKGLGTSTKNDVAQDAKDPKYVTYIVGDPEDLKDSMQKAFNDKLAQSRKDWIAAWDPLFEVAMLKEQTISDFIDHEFILYGLTNLRRALVSSLDGNKSAQRKLVWAAFSQWKLWGAKYKEIKVAGFANFAVGKTSYHHGEKNLCDAVVNMAHDHVGSNNMPYFVQDGMFGTRNDDGDDAADSRYTFTRPEWWLRYVYRKEDLILIPEQCVDGEATEPQFLLPIVPPHIINGTNGVCSGWMSFIPNHNPLEVFSWLRKRLNNEPVPALVPWYRGFRGLIKIIDRNNKTTTDTDPDTVISLESKVPAKLTLSLKPAMEEKKVVKLTLNLHAPFKEEKSPNLDFPEVYEEVKEDLMEVKEFERYHGESDDDTDNLEEKKVGKPKHRYSMITYGAYERIVGGVRVTELPVGKSMDQYLHWLRELRASKVIKSFDDLSTGDTACFEIYGFENPSLRGLRLRRSFGLTNLVVLDRDGKPKRYETVNDLMEAFYLERLEYYVKRYDQSIAQVEERILYYNRKLEFVRLVHAEKIVLKGNSKAQVHLLMDEHKIPHKVLEGTTATGFTTDGIKRIEARIAKETALLIRLKATAPRQLWLNELEELEIEYRKYYKIGPTTLRLMETSPTLKLTITPPSTIKLKLQ